MSNVEATARLISLGFAKLSAKGVNGFITDPEIGGVLSSGCANRLFGEYRNSVYEA